MDTKIFRKVESIISDALKFKYSAQLPNTVTCTTQQVSGVDLHIPFQKNASELKIEFKSEHRAEIFEYRIPQTRISYKIIQTLENSIFIIEYLDKSIVGVDSSQTNELSAAAIYLNSSLKIHSTSGKKSANDQPKKLSNNDCLYLVKEQNPAEKIEDIPKMLSEWIRAEREIHPLTVLKINNPDDCREIDLLWSELEVIDENGKITGSVINDPGYFLWLQEIFIHLGWYDKLDEFYSLTEANIGRINSAPLFELAKGRYGHVKGILGAGSILKQTPKNISPQYSESFLFKITNGFHDDDKHSLRVIQNFWNMIHLPISEIFLRNLAQNNPDELIAFSLFAVKNNFSWFELLKSKLINLLRQDRLYLFRMLCQLNTNASIGFAKEALIVSRYRGDNAADSEITQDENFKASNYSFGKVTFTKFIYLMDLDFRIDKEVQIQYNISGKKIKILPELYQPPFVPSEYNFLEVKACDSIVKVPVIWNQFVIHFNGLRLKFLRKKSRLQITIKFTPKIEKVIIDGNTYTQNENKYLRVTIGLNKMESRFYYAPQNEYYSDLDEMFATGQEAGFRIFGFDHWGILQREFRVGQDLSKKTFHIDSQNLQLPKKILGASDQRFKCYTSRSDQFTIALKSADLILHKVLFCNPQELRFAIKIYLDEGMQEIENNLRKLFFGYLGFIPSFRSIDDIKFDPKFIAIILGKNINADKFYEFKFMPDELKQKAIYIGPALLNRIANMLKFSDLSPENKFDFKMLNV